MMYYSFFDVNGFSGNVEYEIKDKIYNADITNGYMNKYGNLYYSDEILNPPGSAVIVINDLYSYTRYVDALLASIESK
ncbi:hypothetical protein RI065_01795 [Mycoplasmatota bacterium zrk1]